MEHTTDVLQRRLAEQEAKLAEQESHADLTKLQVSVTPTIRGPSKDIRAEIFLFRTVFCDFSIYCLHCITVIFLFERN